MKETYIRNSICSWLRFHDALVVIYDNVGIYDQRLGRYRRRDNVHRILGVADLIVLWKKHYIAIEVKSPEGRVSEHQKIFLEKVNELGGIGFVARSINDVERELKSRGLFP
jgi:penicillin-binding protein-related factor A (putative recombinase)